jgi:hypothetical protein
VPAQPETGILGLAYVWLVSDLICLELGLAVTPIKSSRAYIHVYMADGFLATLLRTLVLE